MAPPLLGTLDALVGRVVEGSVNAHHRRRLQRAGRAAQLEPPADSRLWAAGDPPPRAGCSFEVLIDGAQALPRIAEAITGAKSHVHIAGWHLAPDFGLTRDAEAQELRVLLAEAAERVDVRVLLWAGAPLPVFKPARPAVAKIRDALTKATRVRCALDRHERPMHCHHEKLVIIDDRIAFVGGIDLTSLGGDRFDTNDHPMRGRLGWHDSASRIERARRRGCGRSFQRTVARRDR